MGFKGAVTLKEPLGRISEACLKLVSQLVGDVVETLHLRAINKSPECKGLAIMGPYLVLIHEYIHTHTYIYIYMLYIHTYIHTCVHECIHTYIHVYVYKHICTHVQMIINTYQA